jgi:hypothetical protein
MIVENIKNGKQHYITKEEWATLKENGYQRHYRIIPSGEELPEQKKQDPVPEVQEFLLRRKQQEQTKKTEKVILPAEGEAPKKRPLPNKKKTY